MFGNYNVRTGAGRITGNVQHLEQSSDLLRTELFGTFATGGVQHELTLGAARSDKSQDPIFQRNYGGATTAQNLYFPRAIGFLPLTALPTQPTTGAQDSRELGLYALDRITLLAAMAAGGGRAAHALREHAVRAAPRCRRSTTT